VIKVGHVFGRWEVIAPGGIAPRHGPTWIVRCECGEVRTRRGDNLRSGGSRSCGCLKRDLVAARNRAHTKTSASISPVNSSIIELRT
jgi:hypothetical protein